MTDLCLNMAALDLNLKRKRDAEPPPEINSQHEGLTRTFEPKPQLVFKQRPRQAYKYRARRAHKRRSRKAYELPADVLLHVFELRALDHEHHQCGTRGKKFHWIAEITHVCSGWRAIALAAPLLWAIPQFHHPDCAKEMIKRSQGVPLSLYFEVLDEVDKVLIPELTILRQEIHRTQRLALSLSPHEDPGQWDSEVRNAVLEAFEADVLPILLTRSAPLLESLDITTVEPTILPSMVQLFDCTAPRLIDLSLGTCNLNWGQDVIGCYSSLKRLKISLPCLDEREDFNYDFAIGRMSITDFIPLLSLLPSLEQLHLQEVFRPLTGDEIARINLQDPIPCTKLEDIFLQEQFHLCAIFFESTLLPSTARITVAQALQNTWPGKSEEDNLPDCKHLIEILRPRFQHVRSAHHMHVRIDPADEEQDSYTILQFYRQDFSNASSDAARFDFELDSNMPFEELMTLAPLLPLAELQSASIQTPSMNLAIWNTLARLPSLQSLYLVGVNLYVFSKLMDHRSRAGWQYGPLTSYKEIANNATTSFPMLRSINLDRCTFAELRSPDAPPAQLGPQEDVDHARGRNVSFDFHRLCEFVELRSTRYRLGHIRPNLRGIPHIHSHVDYVWIREPRLLSMYDLGMLQSIVYTIVDDWDLNTEPRPTTPHILTLCTLDL